MKHIIVNKDGQIHAVILECPFKYTAPRSMTVHHDINHDFSQPFNATGKSLVDVYTHLKPKDPEKCNADALDFAVIKDGVVEQCVVWGGAEWLPPVGTMLVPLAKWMGVHDSYDESLDKFSMSDNRKGQRDKDKSVEQLAQERKIALQQLMAEENQDNLEV